MLAFIALALLFMVLVLPQEGIAFLQSEYRLLGRASRWLHRTSPVLDLGHLIAFCLFGCLAGLVARKEDWRKASIIIASVAAISELAQHWIPGREARWSDAAMDLVGGFAGLLMALAVRRYLSRPRSSAD